MPYYVDTSAAKLVVSEVETTALTRWLHRHEQELVSSDLARTELPRLARRAAAQTVGRARLVLDSLTLLTLSTDEFERTAVIEPPQLRSLAALHVAAAMRLGDSLEGIVSPDDRLNEAATILGIPVIAPGAPS